MEHKHTPGPWETVYGHLAVSLAQSIDSDDQIIMGHVKSACDIAKQEMRMERDMARDFSEPISDRDEGAVTIGLRYHQTAAERDRLAALNAELVEALFCASCYLLNAKIDLSTGATKATAIKTIDGGLKLIDADLTKAKEAGQ